MDAVFAPAIAFFLGACFGSFLNVCIYRWPEERSIIRPRSRCPYCGHQLAWFENIPIVSWIVLRARCRCCDEPISMQYPAVELAVGLLWALCAAHYGLTLTGIRVAVTGTILLGVAITDAKAYVIPDGFTVFGLFFSIAMAVVALFTREDYGPFAEPYDALIGACAGAGLIAIVGWLGEVALKKEAMGMGDVTLMAFVGATVGPSRAILTVFVGAALGAVTFGVVYPIARARQGRTRAQHELALGRAPFEAPLVPFGVFLAPAALVTLLWGDTLFAWIIRG